MLDNHKFTQYLNAIANIQSNGINFGEGGNFKIQHVFGGSNNALFRIETESEVFACKLCVEDGRRRAAREYGALKTIYSARIDIAPEPLFLDESKSMVPYPVVFYRWTEGKPLQSPTTQRQLNNFLNSYHQLHSIQPFNNSPFQFDAWFHWFDFEQYLQEITELFDLYTPWLKNHFRSGANLRDRLKDICKQCSKVISKANVDPGKINIPLRLVRVDPNSANAITDSKDKIRWVDWEYSGWGDPALDLAELRWHAALQPLGEETLKWLRTNYKPSFVDPDFSERLRIWDHILATRWPLLILRVLWSNHNGPDRKRLSNLVIPTDQLLARLVYYLELAENLFLGADHVPNWR